MIRTLTHAQAEDLYDWLRLIPPFRAWKLPPGEQVEFSITGHRDRGGHFQAPNKIVLSMNGLHTYMDVIEALAHEMIHYHLHLIGKCDNHGPNFKRVARRVCNSMGLNLRDFLEGQEQ